MTAARSLHIYGAGRMGREFLAHCRATGLEPSAFIDRHADRLGTVDGIPVIAPGPGLDGSDCDVVIALHSPGVNVADVQTDLSCRGYARIETLWRACARVGWLPGSPFWLRPEFSWSEHESAIVRARALFRDVRSLRVFDQQIALRRYGDYAGLDAPTPEDQYVPDDLARWREPMHLIDAGAFDGDTIRVMEQRGYAVEALVALEPDPSNFARLRAAFGDRPGAKLIEAGAAETSGTRSFNAGEGGSAHVNDAGSTTIAVVAIDDLCKDFRPSLIKMDIEGAEQAALDGAAATLRRSRPELAISVYHRVHDLWAIPLAIVSLVPDYRFALRSHAFNGFDTVLYGWVP